MSSSNFKWEARVRDYELDSQGIVNNAVYLNYFEQARNDYVRKLGINFLEYYEAGYYFVMAAVEIQYRSPLRLEDEFYVTATITGFDKRRIYMEQEIKRKDTDKVVARAKATLACMDYRTGRAAMPEMLQKHLTCEP